MTELLIRLHPSRRLALLFGVAHCVAVGTFWQLAIPFTVKSIITLMLMGSLYYYLRQYAWLASPGAIVSLRLTENSNCRAWMQSNNYIDCSIEGDTFVAPYMTVLCLKDCHIAGRRRTIVVLPDAIDPEVFRQLRVWLRWKWVDKRSD